MKRALKSSKRKQAANDEFGERIRKSIVTYDDLAKALLAIDRMPPDDRKDFTARTLAVMRAFGLLTGEATKDKRDLIEKVTCVQIRMDAMARLVDTGVLKKWTMASDERGADFINGAVVRAAAEVPLLGGRKRSDPAHFDTEIFMAKVLELAEREGTA
jgi:hypothetical protein